MINESVGRVKLKEITKEETQAIKSVNVQNKKSFKSKIKVTSMTNAGNNTAWVTYVGSPTMYLCNDKGKIVRSVTVEGSGGINDMIISQSGGMIVTCADKKLRRVSVRDEVSIMTGTAPFDCYGICLNDKEEIVVCMRDQGNKNHVAIYSPDGRNKVREIRAMDGQGKHLLTYPYRVVLNGHELCVVNGLENVVCITERGDVIWVYDGKQAKQDYVFHPRGICRDWHHNLLVTDSENNCVHYLDRMGGLIQLILTKGQTGLQYHYGICVDDAIGQVWVGNPMSDVVVAKYFDYMKYDKNQ